MPNGFFGVVPQGELSRRDFERMQGTFGVLRISLYWYDLEPRPGEYDFGRADALVGEAADHGIRVLPVVYGSPAWLTGDPAVPPLRTPEARAAWTAILVRLVDRYGPRGLFWRGRFRRVPIRRWQIWNEPNFPVFWQPRPSPHGYARLLGAAARAIRGVDPNARIVTAGVAPVEGGPLPWDYLRHFYEQPGVRRSFDVLALHPYAASRGLLAYEIRQVRAVMVRAGDAATPLDVTEFGVASGGFARSPMVKSPAGQALFLGRAYRMLIRNRRRWRLAGAFWFSWGDGLAVDPHCVFCQQAGLFDLSGEAKPSWHALRRVVSGAARIAVR